MFLFVFHFTLEIAFFYAMILVDMYYLKDKVDKTKLWQALDTYIFHDDSMREKEGKDIVKRLKFTFSDKEYIKNLDRSDKRWLDDEIDVITEEILKFASII